MQQDQPDTPSLSLAKQYLSLGGTRRAVVDDDIVSTREWQGDPPEAEKFWQANIETMDPERRKEVELHLPTINAI